MHSELTQRATSSIFIAILAELAINTSAFALGGLETLEEDETNTPHEASKTPKNRSRLVQNAESKFLVWLETY